MKGEGRTKQNKEVNKHDRGGGVDKAERWGEGASSVDIITLKTS